MSTITRIATLVAALIFSLCSTSAAFAATGGGASIASGDVIGVDATTRAAQDDIQTRAVQLTRRQTKSVQKRVRVKADGALGAKTRKAIKRYQKVKDLTPTGTPNVETLRKMKLKLADKLEAKMRAEASAPTAVNVSAPSGTVAAILAAAQVAIGTPYRSAGNTLNGFDCSGFTVWAFKQAGITLPRISFDQYKQGVSIPRADIQPGDLVFFDSAGSGASHVGIATGPTKVISATSSRGVIEHTIASGYWDGHYVGARRVGAAVKARAASAR